MHTHRHEATQRHAGAFLHFHLHLSSVHSKGAGLEFQGLDPDDDAQLQNWCAAAPADAGLSPAVLTECLSVATPEGGERTLDAPQQKNHDPPLLFNKSPRAPPV